MSRNSFETLIVMTLGVIGIALMLFCGVLMTKAQNLQREIDALKKQSVELGYATNIVEYVGNVSNVRWEFKKP